MKAVFPIALFLLATGAALPAAAQDKPGAATMNAQEKAQKQQQNEEAEQLCRSIKDKDKFDECLDLYFLDSAKFKVFLDEHGAKPARNPG